MQTSDVLIIGGGLVGSALAWGLARQKQSVVVLDEGDYAYRASRGNFGLVWVQGKGYASQSNKMADYARWSMKSSLQWPALAEGLLAQTGIDVALQQSGGLSLALSDEDLQEKVEGLEWLANQVGNRYKFEVLDHKTLKEFVPLVGPTIPGATFTTMDGHVNPLKLLLALHRGMQVYGVQLHSGATVQTIEKKGDLFVCNTLQGQYAGKKLVLAAGLGNKALGSQVGIYAPVLPNRGQVLITERTEPLIPLPTNYVRQTDEGTIQLGDSQEDVGYNDYTSTPVLETIAQRAIRCFPILKNKRLIRSWAALRVMSPDGFPIYDESAELPGAYVVTCHSGVTLAANHALTLSSWIASGEKPSEIMEFTGARFR